MQKTECVYIREKTNIYDDNLLPESKILNALPTFHKISLFNSFVQNSIILSGNALLESKKPNFAEIIRPLYNYTTVIQNQPLSPQSIKNLQSEERGGSEWHLSYFNILSLSTSVDRCSQNNPDFKWLISKIIRTKKEKSKLAVYNCERQSFHYFSLENISASDNNFCLNHGRSKMSGKHYIYNNQGVISVVFEELKIFELLLPDQRMDPVIYIYDQTANQSIVFAAGGYLKKGMHKFPLDTIAVYYVNLKEVSKLINCEPLFLIKMKYPRLNPILTHVKFENDHYLIIMGGNHLKELIKSRKSFDENLMRTFFEANIMSESIAIRRVKDCILNLEFIHTKIMATEESLCITMNNEDEIDPNNKLHYFLDAGSIIKYNDKNNKKKYLLFGVGHHKNEVWNIDKFDFLGHKICIYKAKFMLPKSKTQHYKNYSVNVFKNEVFFFEKESLNNQNVAKLDLQNFLLRKKMAICSNNDCKLF